MDRLLAVWDSIVWFFFLNVSGWRIYRISLTPDYGLVGAGLRLQRGRQMFTDLLSGDKGSAPVFCFKLFIPFLILHIDWVNEHRIFVMPEEDEMPPSGGSIPEPAPEAPTAAEALMAAMRKPESQSIEMTATPADSEPELEPLFRLKSVQEYVHRMNKEKGWYDSSRTFGDILALVHSELSEALEDFRAGRHLNQIHFESQGHGQVHKPCGIPTEFADVVIRLLDSAEAYGFDLGRAIEMKLHFNALRPYRHGNKAL